jgi:hypothetical protein
MENGPNVGVKIITCDVKINDGTTTSALSNQKL